MDEQDGTRSINHFHPQYGGRARTVVMAGAEAALAAPSGLKATASPTMRPTVARPTNVASRRFFLREGCVYAKAAAMVGGWAGVPCGCHQTFPSLFPHLLTMTPPRPRCRQLSHPPSLLLCMLVSVRGSIGLR